VQRRTRNKNINLTIGLTGSNRNLIFTLFYLFAFYYVKEFIQVTAVNKKYEKVFAFYSEH